MKLTFLLAFIALLPFLLRYNIWRLPKSKSLPRILMYHNTDPHKPNSGMNITPHQLETHILFLKKRGYQFIKLSELKHHHTSVVVLTFDDGFSSNYTHLFPLLKKHAIPATIFLSPHHPTLDFLSTEQIKEMHASGWVEFGAHTLTHINLLETQDADAFQEIKGSKEYVESLTQKPCISFAYPYGRYDARHVTMVKDLGFECAVTTRKKIIPYCDLQRFELPRLSMNGAQSRFELYLQITRGRYKL